MIDRSDETDAATANSNRTTSARPRAAERTSPWPILVALGFALSEAGVFFGLFPVAVVGLVLLAGSVAGILAESDHVARPARLVVGVGAGFVAVGAFLYTVGTGTIPLEAADGLVGLSSRGLAIATAGALTAVGGAGLRERIRAWASGGVDDR
ncbi:hypothetical protein ACFQGT_00665 [Natrialbaceae archaeon GCM10025810]|uniref:DUF7541 family protein n=1 Tax=Halovalidus salilacus TaxID=3075124 RepID=UPI00360C0EA1